MKIAVLGCGPSGLMAAHAIARNGHIPKIYSKKIPTQVTKNMYLQRFLPGLDMMLGRDEIMYDRRGYKEGYASKVYGSRTAKCSWDDLSFGIKPMWSLGPVYAELWMLYEDHITDVKLEEEDVVEVCQRHPIVFSTLPAPSLCTNGHKFEEVKISIAEFKTIHVDKRNRMVYSGRSQDKWHRFSLINGITAFEYTISEEELRARSPIALNIKKGVKPVGNNCDCWPELTRVGRWAQWCRGILNHHPYEQVTGILASHGLAAA